MSKKLLLIDIDDTICNASQAYNLALEECYKFLRKLYPLINKKLFFETYKEAREQIHLELNGTASMHSRFLYFQRLFEILGLTLEPKLLDEITEIFWNQTYKHLKLYPNIRETLRIVKENNIKIGIVSDLGAHIQIKKLKKLKISEYIDFIVTSEEAGKEKPHPSIFLLALKKANCLPENAVMVGDSVEKDIKGANHVGIISVLFSKQENEEADYVIKDFKQILQILNIDKKRVLKKKVVVFDLMGDIFKEGHIIKKSLFPMLNRKNIKISYERLKDLYVKYTLGKISQENFDKFVPKEVERIFLDSIELDKDAFKIVKWLKKKGYLLGILSNIPKPWGDYLIKKFGLEKYFSVIIFSGEYGTRKPDEELYKIFVEKAKVKPQNCYLIDDTLINLKAARFLLMKTIWRRKEKQEIIFIPDYTITKLIELQKIL